MSNEEREYSKVQWFFMVIFIPIVFALILFGILLSFMGVNVVDQAKEVASTIPFLSEYVKTDEQLIEEEERANIEDLMATINERETEIGLLQQNLSTKETEIKGLLAEIDSLMAQLKQKQETQLQVVSDFKDLGKLYETMSTKNAANILSELPEDEAALHLSYVKRDVRAAILAKMTPEKAAQLIKLLSNDN